MRKPRVIIYDDELNLLELLESCFTRWGYEVFSYRVPVICPVNWNSAQVCKCQTPCADLMISDFLMPQMTGTELFWRQAERGCKMAGKAKAIMSGYSEEKLLKFCENSGYKYFEKPFDYQKLTGWLGECKNNFDLSKQLGGRPVESHHFFSADTDYCLNSSVLKGKREGCKIISPVKYVQTSLN